MITLLPQWKHQRGVTLLTIMLSLEKCKQILNQKGKKYTDDQVKEIRNMMYQLAELMLKAKIKNDEQIRK